MYAEVTFPTIFGAFSILRCVLLREHISLVHAHQAFSTMANEAILHARTMGYKVVFTDHSLFGFADLSSILTNKVLKFTCADVHQVGFPSLLQALDSEPLIPHYKFQLVPWAPHEMSACFRRLSQAAEVKQLKETMVLRIS